MIEESDDEIIQRITVNLPEGLWCFL